MNLVEKEVLGLRMVLDQDDAGMSSILLSGSLWEGPAPALVEKRVRPGSICIEAGACLGLYALIQARAGGTVYAIEPVPSNVEIIRKSVELNGFGDRIKVFQMALGAKTGTARFLLSKTRDRGRFATADADGEVIAVETSTLDDFVAREGLERVDLLRFDVEGAETGLVESGQRTLGSMKPSSWVFADFHPLKTDGIEQTIDSILEHGFEPREILGPAQVQVPAARLARTIAQFQGFPKIFFEKAR